MDKDMPGYAWDLLPYKTKPLDLYRAPMWHAEYDFEKRTRRVQGSSDEGNQIARPDA